MCIIKAKGKGVFMQISAINPSFTGKRDRIDAFINMDDQSLRQIAYMQTINPKADKNNRTKTSLLINSIPLAIGLNAALNSKAGRLGKIGTFAGVAAGWYAGFGIIDLVSATRNKIHEKSEKAREFAQKHPVLSLVNTVAVSLLAIGAAGKGVNKLADKFGPKIINKYGDKIQKSITKLSDKLNNSKVLNKLAQAKDKVSSKIPGGIKEVGKGVLDWTPVILGVSAIVNSSRHASKKANSINDKYIELKDKQIALAQARNRELQIQRDFLLTDPKNVEDLKEII